MVIGTSARFRSSCNTPAHSDTNFASNGHYLTFDSSAAFRFEVPARACRNRGRNFKSAALVSNRQQSDQIRANAITERNVAVVARNDPAIERGCTMFWIMLGLMCGMAAMAILSVDQLDGEKIPSRKQEAISWD